MCDCFASSIRRIESPCICWTLPSCRKLEKENITPMPHYSKVDAAYPAAGSNHRYTMSLEVLTCSIADVTISRIILWFTSPFLSLIILFNRNYNAAASTAVDEGAISGRLQNPVQVTFGPYSRNINATRHLDQGRCSLVLSYRFCPRRRTNARIAKVISSYRLS